MNKIKKSLVEILIYILGILIVISSAIFIYTVFLNPSEKESSQSFYEVNENIKSFKNTNKKIAIIKQGDVDFYEDLKTKLELYGIKYSEYNDVNNIPDEDIIIYFTKNPVYYIDVPSVTGKKIFFINNGKLNVYSTVNLVNNGEKENSVVPSSDFYRFESNKYFNVMFFSSVTSSTEEDDRALYIVTNYFKSYDDLNRIATICSSVTQTIDIDGSIENFNSGECKDINLHKYVKAFEPFILIFNKDKNEGYIINQLKIKNVKIPLFTTSDVNLCNFNKESVTINNNNLIELEPGDCIVISPGSNITILSEKDLFFFPVGKDFSYYLKQENVIKSNEENLTIYNPENEPKVLQIYNEKTYKSIYLERNSKKSILFNFNNEKWNIDADKLSIVLNNKKSMFFEPYEKNSIDIYILRKLIDNGKTIILVGPSEPNLQIFEKYIDHYYFLPDRTARLDSNNGFVNVNGETLIPVWNTNKVYKFRDMNVIPKISEGSSTIYYVPYPILSVEMILSLIEKN